MEHSSLCTRFKIKIVKGGRALHIALGLRAKGGILLDYWQ